jgi:hypothetical protein
MNGKAFTDSQRDAFAVADASRSAWRSPIAS